jgi:hypothetical protein
MAQIKLHLFRDDLKQIPGPGSSAPPRSIRAGDLDENYEKVTVIKPKQNNPVPYELEYTEQGTVLKNIKQLPDGQSRGDLAFWNPEAGEAGKWVVLRAHRSIDLHVLGIEDGILKWVKTEDC